MKKRRKNKGRKGSKKLAQRVHARKRFRSRFGIRFTKEIRREFVRLIQTGQARHIRKQSHRVGIYSIQFEGKWIDVVYDNQRKNIVTCLPVPDRLGLKPSPTAT